MELSELFIEALAFAARLHSGQPRKGTAIPYVSHLMAVAALVLEDGGDEEETIAALLHDSIEDQGWKYPGGSEALRAAIARKFGARVTEIVEACTDADTKDKPLWRERKERHLAHLQLASASVLRITCADKLHNVQTVLTDYRAIGEDLWARFNGGREGTLWYYRQVANLVGRKLPGALATELEATVRQLEQLVAVTR